MHISDELIQFAKGNADFYTAFVDYHNHKSAEEWGKNTGSYDKSLTLAEKSPKIFDAFFAEVSKVSNCELNENNREAWFANPVVKWAEMAIVNNLVNVVLPAYVTSTFAPFVDFRTVGYADVVNFTIPAKTLYTVSKGGRGERTSFRQKKFAGNMVMSPVEHIITTYVDMARVYARKDDLAEAVRAIVVSVEIDMNKEITSALSTGLNGASYPAQFKETGAFEPKKLVQLAQRVQAYNGMAKPIILGTASALMNVLPDSSLGYRMNIDGREGVVSFVKNFYGFDIYELPQAPTGGSDFGMALNDNVLYVISPAVSKAVAGVMSTSMTNSNQFYDNADISQNFTLRKSYDFQFIGAAYAGMYTITD